MIYLPFIITKFHDFPWPTIKFHDFPGLENEILKFHDFPGFPWPVRTLSFITRLELKFKVNSSRKKNYYRKTRLGRCQISFDCSNLVPLAFREPCPQGVSFLKNVLQVAHWGFDHSQQKTWSFRFHWLSAEPRDCPCKKTSPWNVWTQRARRGLLEAKQKNFSQNINEESLRIEAIRSNTTKQIKPNSICYLYLWQTGSFAWSVASFGSLLSPSWHRLDVSYLV